MPTWAFFKMHLSCTEVAFQKTGSKNNKVLDYFFLNYTVTDFVDIQTSRTLKRPSFEPLEKPRFGKTPPHTVTAACIPQTGGDGKGGRGSFSQSVL